MRMHGIQAAAGVTVTVKMCEVVMMAERGCQLYLSELHDFEHIASASGTMYGTMVRQPVYSMTDFVPRLQSSRTQGRCQETHL
jgi:hypothetical protein